VTYPLERVRIEIHKAARTAILYSADTAVRVYGVGLGFDPAGAKTREGDGKTPEGSYYLCSRNPYSRFHRFLGVSYPSPQDAARAYSAGEIDARTTARISRVRSPHRPPWSTPLGGAIGLHGGGSSSDWTLGCIAFEDDDVDEIWVASRSGTRVIIYP
jgi:murein L,D-transpeptidase YafK